ncbi:TPA: hypothetical protein N0F65_006685 [Lagenidium giganteum]|uniref:Uncharacterized protein n=1 Tax=Lagenidium giganteum TaxID=4803 RepID=A0AAV2Z8H6_9STRA|nr:TPA: hypothetical protein N0F65_006685 [Lagenidium giganteum]
MISGEQKGSITTCFAALSKSDEALVSTSRRGTTRSRYSYRLPLVGAVCRATFCKALDIAPATAARHKQRVSSALSAQKIMVAKRTKTLRKSTRSGSNCSLQSLLELWACRLSPS